MSWNNNIQNQQMHNDMQMKVAQVPTIPGNAQRMVDEGKQMRVEPHAPDFISDFQGGFQQNPQMMQQQQQPMINQFQAPQQIVFQQQPVVFQQQQPQPVVFGQPQQVINTGPQPVNNNSGEIVVNTDVNQINTAFPSRFFTQQKHTGFNFIQVNKLMGAFIPMLVLALVFLPLAIIGWILVGSIVLASIFAPWPVNLSVGTGAGVPILVCSIGLSIAVLVFTVLYSVFGQRLLIVWDIQKRCIYSETVSYIWRIKLHKGSSISLYDITNFKRVKSVLKAKLANGSYLDVANIGDPCCSCCGGLNNKGKDEVVNQFRKYLQYLKENNVLNRH